MDFGPSATLDGNLARDYLQLRLRWFDRWLKPRAAGTPPHSPVLLFVMGGGSGRRNTEGRLDHGGQWREESDWPLPRTLWTPYFLHADRTLVAGTQPDRDASIEYEYDPQHPVPTIGGAVANGEPLMFQGGFDQRETPATFGASPPYKPLADRPDVVVFRTAPLQDDLEVSGPVQVTLWISSDCLDTDFTAKLIDEYPPNEDYPEGYALNVPDGIIRALPQLVREARAAHAGRNLPGEDRHLSDIKPVQAGPPAAPGHSQQQLSAFRFEPEHGRTRRPRNTH